MGRESQINQLHQQLQSNQRIAITAVQGMGGVGKTELAWEYAQWSLSQNLYPGGVCWLWSRDQEIATQIVDFSKSHLGMKPPADLEADAQVSFIWQRWPQGEVLIVVDDATEYDAIAPYLPLSAPRFRVLITTRLDFGSSVRSLCLAELDETSALKLLKTLIRQDRIQTQLEDAKALCEWVGNLPLALELLGRYLANDEDLFIQDLLQELESMRLDTEALLEREDGMTAQLGVAAALELSWKNLNDSEKELACLLGMFAIAPIPWQQVESCLPDIPEKDLVRARNKGLLKRNLLKRLGQGTYQLHQIVQEFFRIKLNEQSDDGQLLKTAFCKAMVSIAKKLDKRLKIDVIEEVRASIPHLEEVINRWSNHLNDIDLIISYSAIGQFYEGQGNYGLALPWRRRCFEKCQERFGNEHPDVATSINALAALYYYKGQYQEAEPLFLQALGMRQKLLGEEHPDVANSLNNLANLYANQGRHQEAEPLYLKAHKIYKGPLINEHSGIATSFNILADLYANQGRYTEAEPLFLQAQEMYRSLLVNKHPDTTLNLTNLATLYFDQGRYSEAEHLYIQALEMYKSQLVNEHPDVALSLNNLAVLYDQQGRYSEAEHLYIQALEMRKKLLGEEHPDIAYSLNTLAVLYGKQGRYTEAEPLLTQALEMNKKLLGNEHPNVASNLNNLATLYDLQGQYQKAEPLFLQALEMRQELLGDEHPDVANSLNNLANLYYNQELYAEAEPLLIQALGMNKKLLGNEHTYTATVQSNLDDCHQKMKKSNT